jgi:hypothetical protein
MQSNHFEIGDGKETQTVPDTQQETVPTFQKEHAEKVVAQETKVEEYENTDFQLQLQQLRNEYAGQMSDLRSKVTNLESSALRQPATAEGRQTSEGVGLSNNLRQMYEDKIRTLEKNAKDMEEHINTLLNSQEHSMKYQTEIEGRYRAAVNHIEKEKRAREESELNSRSEITNIRGAYQKEKERAQKLMKTMAEMQSADPFKLDNTNITSTVKELRYDIKNWARAQRLVPSLPVQGLISTYASRAIGMREKGPNYEFLRDVTPVFHEYTDSPQEFKWLLQAYVWKRIVELIFYDDLWAGTRKSLDDDEMDHKLQVGYRSMKLRLQPGLFLKPAPKKQCPSLYTDLPQDEDSPLEYISQYHEWRSNTARILERRISPERRKRTLEIVRDDILHPLYKAVEPAEQEIRNVEDLEAVIESAMRLGASMAQQKAHFTFEFASASAYGKMEFRPQQMTDPFPQDHFDPRMQVRTVWLSLAPRLIKHGTSEGTNFDSCVQLLEGEVETKIMPRKFAVRRQVMN